MAKWSGSQLKGEPFKANSVSDHLGDGDLKTELKLKPLQIRKLKRHMDQGLKYNIHVQPTTHVIGMRTG